MTTDHNIDVEADAVHESKSLHFLEMAVQLNELVTQQCADAAEMNRLNTEMLQKSTENTASVMDIVRTQTNTIRLLVAKINRMGRRIKKLERGF